LPLGKELELGSGDYEMGLNQASLKANWSPDKQTYLALRHEKFLLKKFLLTNACLRTQNAAIPLSVNPRMARPRLAGYA